MGTLYREIVEYKHQKLSRLIFKIMFAVLTFDTIFVLYETGDAIEISDYVGYVILIVALGTGLFSWVRCKTRFRYAIIDKELIIEKLNGKKRKLALNLKIRQIVIIEKLTFGVDKTNIEKEYNFACTGKRAQVYRCVYETNGKLYSFNFEPSPELLRKIDMYR